MLVREEPDCKGRETPGCIENKNQIKGPGDGRAWGMLTDLQKDGVPDATEGKNPALVKLRGEPAHDEFDKIIIRAKNNRKESKDEMEDA